ncbi:MAG: hypothetical protein J7M25_04325 [Deltaproteobacteria bacterium]|nr:hypothetical protein [Deltaproteobacteria bacterium]
MKIFLAIVSMAVASAMGLGAGGCVHTQTLTLETKPIVAHYESSRTQLGKKERSGSEGGCPTCVY